MHMPPPPPPYMHAAGSPRLDLSTPLEECGAIRVALLPVGAIDAATFRRYARLCAAHASQLQLLEITHGQARGALRLCFVAAADLAPSDWDALHAHRRVRAAVGLCDCRRETDLGGAYGRFEADLGRLELGAPRCRCLAFAPALGTDGALLPSDDIEGMTLLPPGDDAAVASHLRVVFEALGADLLHALTDESEALSTTTHAGAANAGANAATKTNGGATGTSGANGAASLPTLWTPGDGAPEPMRTLEGAWVRVPSLGWSQPRERETKSARLCKRAADLLLLRGSLADARASYTRACRKWAPGEAQVTCLPRAQGASLIRCLLWPFAAPKPLAVAALQRLGARAFGPIPCHSAEPLHSGTRALWSWGAQRAARRPCGAERRSRA